MRKRLIAVVLAVMVLSTLTGTAFADLPGTGWVTNTQIQNVGAAQADIYITSYAGGASTVSTTKTAPVGGSVTLLNTELSVAAGFKGAGVVSSTEPVFAILFVTNYGTGAGNTGSAIVRGVGQDSTATKLSFPLAKKLWSAASKKTTTFYIQNAGTAATTITVNVAVNVGPACTANNKTYNINQNEQINFTPADMGCTGPMYGSVTVTSNGQPLAGIVLEHDDDMSAPSGGSRVLQGTTGFSPADADSSLIAPIIKKGWGANKNVTGMQVQNVGAAPIPVGGLTVNYTIIGGPEAGQTKSESNTAAIPVGGAFNSLHAVLVDGTLASATVSAPGQQIVGIVNENRPAGNPQPRATTYSMLASKSASASVSLPLVKEFFGAQGGRCTGVQVVPVGGPAVMELTYKSGAQTYVVTTNSAQGTKTFVYPSNGTDASVSISGGTFADLRGKNFGVTVKSLTGGIKLVAVANESFCPGATRDEDDANYEGFPLP